MKDARTLARVLPAMTQEECTVAFKGSPMKRAKRRGLQPPAAVVLGNCVSASDAGDAELLGRALDDPEPMVREHATWALERTHGPDAPDAESTAGLK